MLGCGYGTFSRLEVGIKPLAPAVLTEIGALNARTEQHLVHIGVVDAEDLFVGVGNRTLGVEQVVFYPRRMSVLADTFPRRLVKDMAVGFLVQACLVGHSGLAYFEATAMGDVVDTEDVNQFGAESGILLGLWHSVFI